jgi:hypothetical protein
MPNMKNARPPTAAIMLKTLKTLLSFYLSKLSLSLEFIGNYLIHLVETVDTALALCGELVGLVCFIISRYGSIGVRVSPVKF